MRLAPAVGRAKTSGLSSAQQKKQYDSKKNELTYCISEFKNKNNVFLLYTYLVGLASINVKATQTHICLFLY